MALCGSFAVVPVLTLLHRPSTGFVLTRVATGTEAKSGAARRFMARASRPDGALPSALTSVLPLAVSSTEPTVTTRVPAASFVDAAAGRTTPQAAPPVAVVKRAVVKTPLPPPTVASPPPIVTTTTSDRVQYGVASWLDTIPTGTCADNAAPMGTTLYLSTATGNTATCRVVSTGPFVVGRVVDVAKATFALLAPPSQGLVNVRVSW